VNTTPVSKVTTQAKETLAIIGLGYVGLPLAVEFGKQYDTIGFDIDSVRIQQLKDGLDRTREVEPELLAEATGLRFTDQLDELRTATTYIVTVPTPIDAFKTPDLSPLRGASRTVAGVLKPGDTVIYESTVYPGATEEVCVPILEEGSGLTFNWDFFVGYSPERINPGDMKNVGATLLDGFDKVPLSVLEKR
jgi:UDP-N-acetyl-D-galactosamine dehydrogenase